MILLTPPTAEPVSVDDVKLALRIDDTAFDPLLPGLIAAARAVAEQETGRLFFAQTWRIERAAWPQADDVLHVYRPTAAAVGYWTGSAWATLATNLYAFAPDAATGCGTVLAPALGTSWPALGSIAIGPRVRIDLTAGLPAGQSDQVPAGIKAFIAAVVGQLLQSPELTAAQAVQASPLLSRLLDPWRLHA